MRRRRAVAAIVTVALAGTANAQAMGRVPAWGAAQMRADGADADRIAAAGPATIRQIAHLSAGGRGLCVRLSNVAGDAPLRIGAAAPAHGIPAAPR